MDFVVLTVNGVDYYTLQDVCKALKYKTQKAFIERFEKMIKTFKGRICGKFISVADYNSIAGVEEVIDSNEDVNSPEVQKKFIRTLYKTFHPDNGGDPLMFRCVKSLVEQQKKAEDGARYLREHMQHMKTISRFRDRWKANPRVDMTDFEEYMKNYDDRYGDKDDIYRTMMYSSDGRRII